jgi:3-deoxy-D-manno-octulosonic-acid transferase
VYGLYSLVLFLALLFYFPVYFIRMKIRRKQRFYLKERLGLKLPSAKPGAPSLWIHAVSVGEVLSLRRLVSEVKARHPSWVIYFSTLTNSGYEVAAQTLPDVEELFFVPLDFGWVVRRFFATLRPRLFVLAESEFWPHLLRQAGRTCRSVILVNGRMSRRSYEKYRGWRRLVLPVLDQVDYFLVQTERDRNRLEAIGVPAQKVEVAGNLKAEVRLPDVTAEEKDRLRSALGLSSTKKVIIAGSTHRGEEALIIEAFAGARRIRPDLVMVIAPRHPERSPEVERVAVEAGLRVMRRTQAQQDKLWDVLILDTIGELPRFYALADLAFVGGSLIPHGGQNFLEPAYYGKPVCYGQHMENFASLSDDFIASGAARVVAGLEELEAVFSMKDEKELVEMGRKAKVLLRSLQGATARTLEVIESRIEEGGKD